MFLKIVTARVPIIPRAEQLNIGEFALEISSCDCSAWIYGNTRDHDPLGSVPRTRGACPSAGDHVFRESH